MLSIGSTHGPQSGSKPLQVKVTLDADHVVEVAKDVIHLAPLMCDWGRCHAELNSWKTLQKHLHQHCQQQEPSSSQQGPWECKITKCSGRYHNSLPELQQHIDLSHLSRILLPCPVQGCSLTFGRAGQGMPVHLLISHKDLAGQSFMMTSSVLQPCWQPHFHPPEALPVLPVQPVPTHILMCPLVSPAPHMKTPTASQTARQRWTRMDARVPIGAEEDDSEDEATPLADLPPLGDLLAPEFREYFVWWKPPGETFLQQSRPQQMALPPVVEKTPAVSIGYEAFAARFEQLEQAGLIDGSGMWPPEDDGESAHEEKAPRGGKGHAQGRADGG